MNILSRVRDAAAEVFGGEPVLFAYLYGSQATGRDHAGSDVDVAVFVADSVPTADRLELSLHLAGRLEEAAEVSPVAALLVLNDAPLALAGRVLHDRKLVYSIDEPARIRFESRTFRQFHDFELHAEPMRRARLDAIAQGAP